MTLTHTIGAGIPYYPLNEFEPFMPGMVMGGMGILHVFLAQFAIGGGMLLCYFSWLVHSGRNYRVRTFLDSYFKVLVLISFVGGALTGVGMWLTAIQVSPRAIGFMVDEFHWIWAIEWTFFCAQVISGYAFYRFGDRLPSRTRLSLLMVYSIAAWASLFWINGIQSWQLTPGQWVVSKHVWSGFFNPSFWPSLLFRTVSAMTLAALVAFVVIGTIPVFNRDLRARLIHSAAYFLVPLVLMPFVGAWYLGTIPLAGRSWILGGSMAAAVFFVMAVFASMLLAGHVILGLLKRRLHISGSAAAVLVVLAFVATAGGELVREGACKPYSIRHVLYSNAIAPDEVSDLREAGSVSADPYPLRHQARYPTSQLRMGAKVFRLQCGVCHTMAGSNGLLHLAGAWSAEQLRMNIAKLQYTKPVMPPFAGNADEVEALAQLIMWERAGAPKTWPEHRDAHTRARIRMWLDSAGVQPNTAITRER